MSQVHAYRGVTTVDTLRRMKIALSSLLSIVPFAAWFACPSPAMAGCGSDFCSLNTTWDVQDPTRASGSTVLDLRYEFIRQDRLRAGNSTVTRDEATAIEDHAAELYTYNRNLIATLDHAFSPKWGVTAQLPLVNRSHAHIHDPTGHAEYETWQFRDPGDMRVVGRYRLAEVGSAGSALALQFGVKLPTGDYKVANADGLVAERMLQPGTGSTDAILGVLWTTQNVRTGTGLFAQAAVQHAVAIRDDYRPGDLYTVNAGVRHPVAQRVSALFQLNAIARNRESGANAESELSGGLTVLASPGLAVAITPNVQAYGFVQLPVYRYANGVQLSYDWAVVVGASARF